MMTHVIKPSRAKRFQAGHSDEIRVPVERGPLPFSHVYQHPTEKWWTFGDNSGTVHDALKLTYWDGGNRVQLDTAEPFIDACPQTGRAEWVFRQPAAQPVATQDKP